MNKETDTVFLQTLGKFISVQIQLAMQPLMQTINAQGDLILKLQNENEKFADELNGAIEGTAAEISRIDKFASGFGATIQGKDGRDGKDAEPLDYDAINEIFFNLLEENIKKFSVKDGADGKNGVDGKDGADCDMDSVMKRIDGYIAGIPLAKDGANGASGKDGVDGATGPAGKDGAPGVDGRNGLDGKDGVSGRDGADVVSAFRDRDDYLILTLSNGTIKDIGPIHGKDGEPGAPGKDGKDGRDGFSLDDFDVIQLDERTIEFSFAQSSEKKIGRRFSFPILIDRGVWKQGNYLQGDVVTFGGSLFIAQCDTDAKPETKDWRLAVKRGVNGNDGKDGQQGKQGLPGKDGRDLTQLGPDGRKWG